MTAERTAPGAAAEAPSPPDRSALPGPGARIHLMGVGGAGMRGLALLLAEAGYRVSGCDRSGVPAAPELESRGIALAGEHGPGHVEGAELVIRSAAVPEDHPELAEAERRGIPAMKRARALGAMVNGARLAAISGTHGKTTITAMTAHALREAGRDPTVAVGGKAPGLEGYAAAGTGELAVVEADEFDRSFLELDPHLLVVSSLEPEHVESFPSFAAAEEAYRTLARRAGPRLGVLYCADDEGARRVGEGVEGSVGYGRSPDAAFRLEEGREDPDRHVLVTPDGSVGFTVPVVGAHNRLNAAAALSTAMLLGVDPGELDDALAEFRGVERRLELLYESDALAVLDDYAHHPTEVVASLEAARERYPERTLVAVLQPHLYSRTEAFASQFGRALARADLALVLPIFPSREDPIPGVSADRIVEAAPSDVPVRLAESDEVTVPGELPGRGGPPRVIVFMGAGDVTAMARSLVRRLEAS